MLTSNLSFIQIVHFGKLKFMNFHIQNYLYSYLVIKYLYQTLIKNRLNNI